MVLSAGLSVRRKSITGFLNLSDRPSFPHQPAELAQKQWWSSFLSLPSIQNAQQKTHQTIIVQPAAEREYVLMSQYNRVYSCIYMQYKIRLFIWFCGYYYSYLRLFSVSGFFCYKFFEMLLQCNFLMIKLI